MRLVKAAGIGIGFALLAFGIINSFGFNYYTFSALLYLYIMLPVVLVIAEMDFSFTELRDLRSSFLLVVDREERKIKRVFSGEEFKIIESEKVE